MDRCSVFAADVSSFRVNVSSFRPDVSTFRANVSSLRPNVSSGGCRRARPGGLGAEIPERVLAWGSGGASERRRSTKALASGDDARARGVHRIGVDVFSFRPNVFSFRPFPPPMCSLSRPMCSVGVDDAFGLARRRRRPDRALLIAGRLEQTCVLRHGAACDTYSRFGRSTALPINWA